MFEKSMADTAVVSENSSCNLTYSLSSSIDITCENCIAMKNRLHNVSSELESAQLIIKLLQEEINLKSETTSVNTDEKNSNHDSECNHVTKKPNTWIKVPSNKGKISNKPLVQQCHPIPTTVNQYDILHNLNDVMK
jgi:hypothetical protein